MATSQEVMQVKQMVREAMQEEGVSADTLIRLGQMAEAVLKDKSCILNLFKPSLTTIWQKKKTYLQKLTMSLLVSLQLLVR